MKFNFIHFSDTHLGDHLPKTRPADFTQYRGNDFLNNFLKVMDYINKHINSIDLILHTGDFFDNPSPPLYLREIVVNSMSKIIHKAIPMYILIGNHEVKGFPKELTELSSNIHIIEESKTEFITIKKKKISITGIPYIKKSKNRIGVDFLEELQKSKYDKEKADYKILLFHQIVEGARVGSDNWRFPPMKNVIPIKVIPENFNYMGVGHIHKAQIIKKGGKKIILPGSTERVTFSEVFEDKGFYHVYVKENLKTHEEFKTLPCRKMFEYEIDFNNDDYNSAMEKFKKLLKRIPKNGYGKVRFTGQISYDIFSQLEIDKLKEHSFICHFYFKKLKITHENKHIFLIKKSDKKGCNISMVKTQISNFKVKTIPSSMGLYTFYSKKNYPVYIGKSKNIRRRIREMLTEASTSFKLEELFKNAATFDFELIENETELLLKESYLLDKFKPRYNTQKTGKLKTLKYMNIKTVNHIPFLTLDNDINDHKGFLGPFLMNDYKEENFPLFLQLMEFPICEGNIYKNPNLCYQFLMKSCIAPCKGEVELKKYKDKIKELFSSPSMFLERKKNNFTNAKQIELFEEYHQILERIDMQKKTNGIFIYTEKSGRKNLILLKRGIIKKISSCKNDELKKSIEEMKRLYKKNNGPHSYDDKSIENFNILMKLLKKSGEFIKLDDFFYNKR